MQTKAFQNWLYYSFYVYIQMHGRWDHIDMTNL